MNLLDFDPPPKFTADRKAGLLTIEFKDVVVGDEVYRRTFWAPPEGGAVLEVLPDGSKKPAYVRLYGHGKPLTLRPGKTLWSLIKREFFKRQETIYEAFDYKY